MQRRHPVVRRLSSLALAVLVSVTVLTGCGGRSGDTERFADGTTSATPSETSGSASASAPASDSLVVTTRRSDYGTVLFDGRGQAIYLFEKETTDRPECYGSCAVAWPPVLTGARPDAAGAARADLLGTTQRRDGTTQVTYDGHPLYYYVDDGAGQILCHNVNEFGGLWLVVTPTGTPAA